jgi:hypothetical protein
LSKNHLDGFEYRWLYPFVMTQFLDERLSAKVRHKGSFRVARKWIRIFWTMSSIFWTSDGVICALGYNEGV